jgi:phage-related baseplate assembly protein
MSRNPEYKFVGTDTNTLLTDLIRMYQLLTGKTLSPASPDRMFVQWVANALLIALRSTNYTGNQNLPSRAEGENLDSLGELFQNTARPLAQPAVSTLRFHITNEQPFLIPIPAGTRVTDSNIQARWATTEDAFVEIDKTSVDVPIECITPGVIGNGFMPGQIKQLIDIANVPFYKSCENITISEGGADEATDDEYYNLLRDSQDSFSTAGAKNAYIYHAKKVSLEISDVIANTPSPGQVDLYVLMKDGSIAGEELKSKVYAACNADDVRPLTDYVVIKDAEQVGFNVKLKYYMPSRSKMSSEDTRIAVEEAVNSYIQWQCSTLGLDIVPDRLIKRIMNTGGVKRVEITEPVYRVLRDGKSSEENTQPQVATIGSVNVESGGFEDE